MSSFAPASFFSLIFPSSFFMDASNIVVSFAVSLLVIRPRRPSQVVRSTDNSLLAAAQSFLVTASSTFAMPRSRSVVVGAGVVGVGAGLGAGTVGAGLVGAGVGGAGTLSEAKPGKYCDYHKQRPDQPCAGVNSSSSCVSISVTIPRLPPTSAGPVIWGHLIVHKITSLAISICQEVIDNA